MIRRPAQRVRTLFYTVDADAGELQERAREIVRRAALADCFLTLQTLCEFFASTTRKGKLTPAQAAYDTEVAEEAGLSHQS